MLPETPNPARLVKVNRRGDVSTIARSAICYQACSECARDICSAHRTPELTVEWQDRLGRTFIIR